MGELRRLVETSSTEEAFARTGLLPFTRYTFPGFQVSWHHRLLAREIDNLIFGRTTRLMVFTPPRHTKTEFVSRRAPALILGHFPSANIIAASYAADLADRNSRDVQRIMDSPEYMRLFPDTVLPGPGRPGGSIRRQDIFETIGHRGSYRAAGVGVGITGMGFEWGFIDDPFKDAAEAESPTVRERVWEWYTSTFRTRMNTEDARICIIMTRWHEDDLCGRLLNQSREDGEADQWRVIRLPGVGEGPLSDDEAERVPRPPPEDQRKEGEALWPGRYGERFWQATKATMPAHQFAALVQQRPSPRGGGYFRRDWFEIVDEAPTKGQVIRIWDQAASAPVAPGKPSRGDWTVGTKLLRAPDKTIFILDVRRFQGTPHEVEKRMRATAEADGKAPRIFIEEEPGSSGKNNTHFYKTKVLLGWSVTGYPASGPKELRAIGLASWAEVGNVKLVRGPWVKAWLDEIESFPTGAHDDQVDSAAHGFNILMERELSTAELLRQSGKMP